MLPSLPAGEMEEVCASLAKDAGVSVEEVYQTIERLEEVNPMLGFRGCRLGITFPEITATQVGMAAGLNVYVTACVSWLCYVSRCMAIPSHAQSETLPSS